MPGLSVVGLDDGLQRAVIRPGRSLNSRNDVIDQVGETAAKTNESVDIPLPVRRPKTP